MKQDSLDALVLPEAEDQKPTDWRLWPVIVAGTLLAGGAAGLAWTWVSEALQDQAATPGEGDIAELVEQYRADGPAAGTLEAREAAGAPAGVDNSDHHETISEAPRILEIETVEKPAPVTVNEPAEVIDDRAQTICDGKFCVQAASFEVKETAERVAAELKARGFEAFATNYGGPKAGWWHVVRIGPFDSRIAAEKQRLELAPALRDRAYVLPRSNGRYHVQLASLHDQTKAERLATRMQQRGHRARVISLGPKGPGQWHCVRIGPFDDRTEAIGYQKLLADKSIEGQVIPFVGE